MLRTDISAGLFAPENASTPGELSTAVGVTLSQTNVPFVQCLMLNVVAEMFFPVRRMGVCGRAGSSCRCCLNLTEELGKGVVRGNNYP